MKALKLKRRRMSQSIFVSLGIEDHSLKLFMKRNKLKRCYRKISIWRFNKNKVSTPKMKQRGFK